VGEFRSPTADFAFYHSLNIRKNSFLMLPIGQNVGKNVPINH
jgi:hypothetical protein